LTAGLALIVAGFLTRGCVVWRLGFAGLIAALRLILLWAGVRLIRLAGPVRRRLLGALSVRVRLLRIRLLGVRLAAVGVLWIGLVRVGGRAGLGVRIRVGRLRPGVRRLIRVIARTTGL